MIATTTDSLSETEMTADMTAAAGLTPAGGDKVSFGAQTIVVFLVQQSGDDCYSAAAVAAAGVGESIQGA